MRIATELHVFNAQVHPEGPLRFVLIEDVPEAAAAAAAHFDHGLPLEGLQTAYHIDEVVVELELINVNAILILVEIDARVTQQGVTVVQRGDLGVGLTLEGLVVKPFPDGLLEGARVKQKFVPEGFI